MALLVKFKNYKEQHVYDTPACGFPTHPPLSYVLLHL